jgi:pyruvate,water dikinase
MMRQLSEPPLTQLTLGVDRDSEIVAFDFDERDPGMLEMLKLAVLGAKRNGRHIGICGEAPANYPEIARYLAQLGINSISVNLPAFFEQCRSGTRRRALSGGTRHPRQQSSPCEVHKLKRKPGRDV